MGRVGGGVGVSVRIGVLSSVLGIFRNMPYHNTGTTRGPHQIPRFLYFILDNNPLVRSRRLPDTIVEATVLRSLYDTNMVFAIYQLLSGWKAYEIL